MNSNNRRVIDNNRLRVRSNNHSQIVSLLVFEIFRLLKIYSIKVREFMSQKMTIADFNPFKHVKIEENVKQKILMKENVMNQTIKIKDNINQTNRIMGN